MEFSNELIRSLGMTLVHSIWQGAVVSAIMFSLLVLIGKSNARLRYIISFTGLMLLLTGFFTTLVLVQQQNDMILKGYAFSQKGLIPAEYALHHTLPLTPGRFILSIFAFLEPMYPALAAGWIAGFLLIGFRITGSTVLSRMGLRKSLILPDVSLQDRFDGLQGYLKMTVNAQLRISVRRISPMVIGFFKPLVVLPAAAISGLSPAQVEAIMIHELAHIRRFDHLLVILQAIAEQVLFFNPAAWFLLRVINRERENCCDDVVLKTNNNPIHYIKALTMIQEMNLNSAVPAIALTGKSNQLLDRVRRLVKPQMKRSPALRLAVILFFFATVGISAMTLLVAAKPDGSFGERNQTTGTIVIDELQPDSTGKVVMNGSISSESGQKKDDDKKKLKVVFLNDTIKEMTINGKTITGDEMKKYSEEIMKIRQEMENSQKELEKMQQELERSRQELAHTMQQIDAARGEFRFPDRSEFEWKFQEALPEAYFNPQDFEKLLQNKEFTEQMKKAREEGRKAMEENRKAMEEGRKAMEEALRSRQEYWQQHQDEFREQMKKIQEEMQLKNKEYWNSHKNEIEGQMKKAREEARKAFEEQQKYKELFYLPESPGLPPFPPVPEIRELMAPEMNIEVPEVPEVGVMIDTETEVPVELETEEPLDAAHKSESLNSRLKELEEGE